MPTKTRSFPFIKDEVRDEVLKLLWNTLKDDIINTLKGEDNHRFSEILTVCLSDSCVEIRSLAHGRLVQKLCFMAGISWCEDDFGLKEIPSGVYINIQGESMSWSESKIDYLPEVKLMLEDRHYLS